MTYPSSASGESRFDLRGLRQKDREWKRAGLFVLLAGIAGLGLEATVFLVQGLGTLEARSLSSSSSQVFLFGLFVNVVAVAICIIILPRALSGAEFIIVDGTGLRLQYPRGREDWYSWNGPRTSFTLQDFSNRESEVKNGTCYYLYGAHIWKRRSFLTRESFDAILAMAKDTSARIDSRLGSEALYGKPPTIHRIRLGGS